MPLLSKDLHRLRSQNVQHCCSAGSGESRSDRDGVLTTAEITREGRDGEGLRRLSGSEGQRCVGDGNPLEW